MLALALSLQEEHEENCIRAQIIVFEWKRKKAQPVEMVLEL